MQPKAKLSAGLRLTTQGMEHRHLCMETCRRSTNVSDLAAEYALYAAALAARPPCPSAAAWLYQYVYMDLDNLGDQSERERATTELIMRQWGMDKKTLGTYCNNAHFNQWQHEGD